MNYPLILQIFVLFLSPFLYYAIGKVFLSGVVYYFAKKPTPDNNSSKSASLLELELSCLIDPSDNNSSDNSISKNASPEVLKSEPANLKPTFCDSLHIVPPTVSVVLGLIINLNLLVLLKSIGLAWGIAHALSFFPVVFFLVFFSTDFFSSLKQRYYKQPAESQAGSNLLSSNLPRKSVSYLLAQLFTKISTKLFTKLYNYLPKGLNFTLWVTVILVLGTSIVSVINHITTNWENNYGDLSFHLGMISSFTFGDNFPPQYHLYPPLKLSYSFFVNLWTASFFYINPNYRIFPFILCMQWVFVWITVFKLLPSKKFPLLPWAILLGGGSFVYVYQAVSAYYLHFNVDANMFREPELSASFRDKGLPILPYIASIWIPQRSSLLGILVLLSGVNLYQLYKGSSERWLLLVIGCLLGLSPLVHFHFFFVGTLVLGFSLFFRHLFRVIFDFSLKRIKSATLDLLTMCMGLALAVFPMLFISSKSGMLEKIKGWMVSEFKNGFNFQQMDDFTAAVLMWFANIGQVFIFSFLILFVFGLRRTLGIISLSFLLFLGANFVLFCVWSWDQTKIFVALYCLLLAIIFAEGANVPRSKTFVQRMWKGGVLNFSLLCLILPGFFEMSRELIKAPGHVVNSKEDLQVAKEIIQSDIPPRAIFFAKADHNSPITLTGRKLFLGCEGTLWSHKISYTSRQNRFQNMEEFFGCKNQGHSIKPYSSQEDPINEQNIMPDYLFWSYREKAKWKDFDPSSCGSLKKVIEKNGTVIYKLEKNA